MLIELYIENFILIEKLTIPFHGGLNVLTGETGAGKSIIFNAIDLILGGKSNKDWVRTGANKAIIQGAFEVEDDMLIATLSESGFEVEDGMLTITREISSNGKSVSRINSRIAPVNVVKSIRHYLVNIHGQNEHQVLMSTSNHLNILDNYCGETIQSLKLDIKDKAIEIKGIEAQIEDGTFDESEAFRQIELLEYQIEEIDNAGLTEGEDEALEEKLNYLKNIETISKEMNSAYFALNNESGVNDTVDGIINGMASIKDYDNEIGAIFSQLSNISYAVQDMSTVLRNYIDSIDMDSETLFIIEKRYDLIQNLKRKYGSEIRDIMNFRDSISDALEKLRNRELILKQLRETLSEAQNQYKSLADQLTEKRKKISGDFEKEILNELNQLNFKNTTFQVVFNKKDGFGENGQDKVEFFISTNLGEPVKPLKKVASGGELSRIMLAVKIVSGKLEGVPTLIFDEVDTGISGITANIVGEKLFKISLTNQVITVTHLPQIAIMSDNHLFIEKNADTNGTSSFVEILDNKGIMKEIGRMIGGDKLTDLTLKNALEMIENANSRKNKIK